MRKSILALVLVCLIMLLAVSCYYDQVPNGDLYINNASELKAFRDAVNKGESFEGKTVVLLSDVDVSDENWVSIGETERGSDKTVEGIKAFYDEKNIFKGTFDGDGHSIKIKLEVEPSGKESFVGFFGIVGGNGEIKNLTINGSVHTTVGVDDTSSALIGAIYSLDGETFKVTKCINNASIVADNPEDKADSGSASSGIVGRAYGFGSVVILECVNNGDVTVKGKASGIIAYAKKTLKGLTIDGCKNSGKIQGKAYSGGMIGYMEDFDGLKITNNENTGDIYMGYDHIAGNGSEYKTGYNGQIVGNNGWDDRDGWGVKYCIYENNAQNGKLFFVDGKTEINSAEAKKRQTGGKFWFNGELCSNYKKEMDRVFGN